MFHVFVIINCL